MASGDLHDPDGQPMLRLTTTHDEILHHKPEPYPWRWSKEENDYLQRLRCRFCDLPIQRRGLFRRWRHVT